MSEVPPKVAQFLQSEFLKHEQCLATDEGCGEDTCPICIFRGVA